MRKIFATALHGVLLLSAFLSTYASAQTIVTTSCPPTLNHTLPRLQDEAPQNLCQYAGKVILVVNTASYCGYTVQYEGLEKLYAKYKDQGLVVLGFSSNDFGQQEPADNKKIAEFCHNTYGVKFPMFAKTAVIGPNSNTLYTSLMKAGAQAPKWNFHKILIDRKGHVLASYPSQTTPDDKKMTADIVQALSQK